MQLSEKSIIRLYGKIFMMLLVFSASVSAAGSAEETAPPHECTSWMVFPDVTGENTTVLHKSRDSKSKNVMVMIGNVSGRKWFGIGGKNSPCMAFNSSGLAGVMNGGEKCNDISTNKKGKTTPVLLLDIISSCDTAAQAVKKLTAFHKQKDYCPRTQGSIFFFADIREGYLIEFTANHIFTQKCDTGYVARANIWHHPGLAKYALTDLRTYLVESTREYVVRTAMNTAFRKNGKVTVEDMLALARTTENPKGAPNNRSVCCSWTNSTATFVIDRKHPDVLSTAYACVGHPRHTVLLPFPVCLKKVPSQLASNRWSARSYARLKTLKTRSAVPSPWLDFEKESLARYKKAVAAARSMLEKGERGKAVELLNNTFESIWAGAEKLPGLCD